MLYRLAIFFILLTLTSSCYKNHLYVQQEWFNRNSLASTKVGTPDPRQEKSVEVQRLIVCWKFPSEIFCEGLKLALTVRFWDNKEELIHYSMQSPKSYHIFSFPNQKILTYKIEVLNPQEEIIEVWEHQFWTKLISL